MHRQPELDMGEQTLNRACKLVISTGSPVLVNFFIAGASHDRDLKPEPGELRARNL